MKLCGDVTHKSAMIRVLAFISILLAAYFFKSVISNGNLSDSQLRNDYSGYSIFILYIALVLHDAKSVRLQSHILLHLVKLQQRFLNTISVRCEVG